MAEKLWKDLMTTATTNPIYKDYVDDFNILGDKSKSLDELVDAILALLRKL